jgi:ankyrin repeat protein
MVSLLSHFYRATAWAGLVDKNHSLQHSSNCGHDLSVKAWLRAGANVHSLDDAALRLAAWEGHTDVVKTLLEHGANIHAAEDEAFQSKHPEIIELLNDWAARGPGIVTP